MDYYLLDGTGVRLQRPLAKMKRRGAERFVGQSARICANYTSEGRLSSGYPLYFACRSEIRSAIVVTKRITMDLEYC